MIKGVAKWTWADAASTTINVKKARSVRTVSASSTAMLRDNAAATTYRLAPKVRSAPMPVSVRAVAPRGNAVPINPVPRGKCAAAETVDLRAGRSAWKMPTATRALCVGISAVLKGAGNPSANVTMIANKVRSATSEVSVSRVAIFAPAEPISIAKLASAVTRGSAEKAVPIKAAKAMRIARPSRAAS